MLVAFFRENPEPSSPLAYLYNISNSPLSPQQPVWNAIWHLRDLRRANSIDRITHVPSKGLELINCLFFTSPVWSHATCIFLGVNTSHTWDRPRLIPKCAEKRKPNSAQERKTRTTYSVPHITTVPGYAIRRRSCIGHLQLYLYHVLFLKESGHERKTQSDAGPTLAIAVPVPTSCL